LGLFAAEGYDRSVAKPFLTAYWGNLLLLNYAVPAAVLEAHLPGGCELDTFRGSPYLSLVAFQFTRTRVFGFRWPGFTNFPELNLRFYVRHGGKRGVCFVREFVPSGLVAGIARVLYNEPYAKARMSDAVERRNGEIHARYDLAFRGSSLEFRATAMDRPHRPAEDSLEHFFKEHDLGVGRSRAGETLTYRVEHPVWRVFPMKDYFVRVDAALYGDEFAFLARATPDSVVLAEGSEIVVYGKD
jgi:uncharacterized protein YqjF (DUF2071 family)